MLHITHSDLERAYDLLRHTRPFSRWGLDEPDDVEFHAVPIAGGAQAEHYYTTHHVIRLNPARHKTIAALLQTLAHEMCHMREYELGARRKGCHGALFHKLADLVCKHHGFDRGQF